MQIKNICNRYCMCFKSCYIYPQYCRPVHLKKGLALIQFCFNFAQTVFLKPVQIISQIYNVADSWLLIVWVSVALQECVGMHDVCVQHLHWSELDQKQPDCCVRYKDIFPSLYETECTSKGGIQFLCEEKF